MVRVKVIGAGISGLSVAYTLLQAGHDVVLITKDRPEHTTSAKAAAIWFPYAAKPLDKVLRWSALSYQFYDAHFVGDPLSGVKMASLYVLDTAAQAESWLPALPKTAVEILREDECPPGYHGGYKVLVPLIDTSIFLPYLCSLVHDRATTVFRAVTDLQDELDSVDYVINCCGLEASNITDDPELYPIRGQIMKIKNVGGILPMSDDHGPNALAYIIPRTTTTILGGTAEPHLNDIEPSEQVALEIERRCRNLQPLGKIEILEHVVGLRPGRSSVRLEKDPLNRNIIHNYGHGGSGYTVCWGCAQDIKAKINGH